MENNKTPSIRFKGFTDPWEQRKLGDIITEYKVTVDSDCTLPILTSSKTEGVILQEEHFGRKQHHDITGYNILPRNYCTYRNRSDGVDFTFNINKCCDKGIISKFYPVFSGKNSDVFFLSLVLNNSDEVVREIAYTCTGTGQKVLSFLDLQKMKVRVPNFDEQKEIAAYFESLDHLITLHQRKYDKLQNIKKSMLEKMFPKNGSNVPEIRFSGFTDPWEQRKVLDLLELLTDYDANGSFADMAKNVNTTDGDGYAWYVRITDLENPKPLSELKYVDESSYEFLKKTELHGGELLMAKRGDIGKVYIFEPRTKYATVAPNMYLLKLNNKVIPHFLYDYFVSEEGNKKLIRLNASSTMGALYKDDVKNIDVIMPSIEEQAMIGNFFQSIDHLITLHQRELEKLQNIKKSMLEKMFV